MGDSSRVVTGIAEYTCKTRLRHLEPEIQTRPVSAIVVEGEDPAVKLAEAARKLEKTIAGCYDVRFQKMLPEAKPAATEPKKSEEASLGMRFLMALGKAMATYGESVRRCQEAGESYYICKGAP